MYVNCLDAHNNQYSIPLTFVNKRVRINPKCQNCEYSQCGHWNQFPQNSIRNIHKGIAFVNWLLWECYFLLFLLDFFFFASSSFNSGNKMDSSSTTLTSIFSNNGFPSTARWTIYKTRNQYKLLKWVGTLPLSDGRPRHTDYIGYYYLQLLQISRQYLIVTEIRGFDNKVVKVPFISCRTLKTKICINHLL